MKKFISLFLLLSLSFVCNQKVFAGNIGASQLQVLQLGTFTPDEMVPANNTGLWDVFYCEGKQGLWVKNAIRPSVEQVLADNGYSTFTLWFLNADHAIYEVRTDAQNASELYQRLLRAMRENFGNPLQQQEVRLVEKISLSREASEAIEFIRSIRARCDQFLSKFPNPAAIPQ
jgi:hypothetical protein